MQPIQILGLVSLSLVVSFPLISGITQLLNFGELKKGAEDKKELVTELTLNLLELNSTLYKTSDEDTDQLLNLLQYGSAENFPWGLWYSDGVTTEEYNCIGECWEIDVENIDVPNPLTLPLPDPGELFFLSYDSGSDWLRQDIPWDTSYSGHKFTLAGYLGGTEFCPNITMDVSIWDGELDNRLLVLASVVVTAEDRNDTQIGILKTVDGFFPYGIPIGSNIEVAVLFNGVVEGPIDCFADSLSLFYYY